MIGALLALIWIAVMFEPTVPVSAGDADKAGVDVMTGTAVGSMRIVHGSAVPAPLELEPVRLSKKSPLWVGVPTMPPVPLTLKPLGSPLAPHAMPVSEGRDTLIW